MRKIVDVQQLKDNFNLVDYLFPKSPKNKNAVLAVCYCPDKNVNLHDISEFAPYAGLIGPGKNYTDRSLSYFELFRMHVVFHDAFIFMKSNFDSGSGYVHAVTEKPFFVNNMLLGNLSNLAYWLYLKLFHGTLYEQFAFKSLQKLASSMSVALELPAFTMSLPFSQKVSLKASLSTQDPKILIERKTNGIQSNIRLSLTELARLNQTIQIICN